MIPREMLYIADEVFFTGTAAEVTPLRSIDRITVGAGKRGTVTTASAGGVFCHPHRRQARPAQLADAGGRTRRGRLASSLDGRLLSTLGVPVSRRVGRQTVDRPTTARLRFHRGVFHFFVGRGFPRSLMHRRPQRSPPNLWARLAWCCSAPARSAPTSSCGAKICRVLAPGHSVGLRICVRHLSYRGGVRLRRANDLRPSESRGDLRILGDPQDRHV